VSAAAGDITGAVVRFLGGDPDVFRPIARAHGLLVLRRAGLVRNRGALAKATPFRILCLFALLYGVFGAMFVAGAKLGILGDAIAVAVGCVFLLMVVVTDHIDVLVNPREQLVLGAHPHDDRSILLAKLWVVGRTLAILFALLSLPTTLAVALRQGIASAVLYLAGAAAAALAASTAGLYLGVAVLALFGRKGYERTMPWLQLAFQLSYFVFVGGERLLRAMRTAAIPPFLAWIFPALWFLAPLQALQEGGFSPATAGRSALAAALVVGLCAGGTRWLGSRIGERLLEPIARRSPKPARALRGRGRGRDRIFASSEGRRLFDLLRLQLKADWKTRSEFLMAPVLCAIFLSTSMRTWSAWMALGLMGWLVLPSVDVVTRSPRPELLWFLLVSPMDRARFSRSVISLMRAFQLLPLLAVFAAFRWKFAGETLVDRVLFLALLACYLDLLLVAGRGLFPEFPFSRAAREETSMGGRRMALLLTGGVVSAVGTGSLYLLAQFGRPGVAGSVAALALLHLPAGWWMRRRVAAAADGLELEAGSVA
jgi:hypothetical protein